MIQRLIDFDFRGNKNALDIAQISLFRQNKITTSTTRIRSITGENKIKKMNAFIRFWCQNIISKYIETATRPLKYTHTGL